MDSLFGVESGLFNPPVHPVAAIFPMMTDEELDGLAEDIATNGQRFPIILDADGQLIDGRNRLEACKRLGLVPTFGELNEQDPIAFILSANVARRHMTKGQIAMAVVVARLPETGRSNVSLGRSLGISHQRLSVASIVHAYAPDLAPSVISGAEKLDAAHAEAQRRKVAAESTDSQLATLRAAAPDIADLVVEDTLGLSEALAALAARRKEQDQARWATSKLVVELLEYAKAAASTPAMRAETVRNFDPEKARQRGTVTTRASLLEASRWLADLAEEWPS